ncbi:hypothetical protein ACFQHO_45565 [Actinomadura yumaensis]|uniref:hypothetical protein n=1 Tax=Actinomadura yumaensis TaxID=111807 RepID=UPI003615E895
MPGAKPVPPEVNRFAARKVGTPAFWSAARKRPTPYEVGWTRYAPRGAGGMGAAAGRTWSTRWSEALNGLATLSTLAPNSIQSVCPVTSYGRTTGQVSHALISGYSQIFSRLSAHREYGCRIRTTWLPAGYRLPFAVNGADARSISICPVLRMLSSSYAAYGSRCPAGTT